MRTMGLMALLIGASTACGGHSHEVDSAAACADDPRADSYSAGMEKSGATFTVRLLEADPAPPARFENTWTVDVLDASDAQLAGVAIDVKLWMPDHGHGSNVEVGVTAGAAANTWTLDPLDLWMPGIWEITLNLDHEGTEDAALFTFCIAE